MRHGAKAALCSMRAATLAAVVACLMTFVVARPQPASATTVRTKIDRLIRDAIAHHGINAAIVQATVNGRPLITRAYGTSMTGVPATTKMHFRNGAVATSYISTLLLRLVDQGKVKLDDTTDNASRPSRHNQATICTLTNLQLTLPARDAIRSAEQRQSVTTTDSDRPPARVALRATRASADPPAFLLARPCVGARRAPLLLSLIARGEDRGSRSRR